MTHEHGYIFALPSLEGAGAPHVLEGGTPSILTGEERGIVTERGREMERVGGKGPVPLPGIERRATPRRETECCAWESETERPGSGMWLGFLSQLYTRCWILGRETVVGWGQNFGGYGNVFT